MLPITVIILNKYGKPKTAIESALKLEPSQIIVGSYHKFNSSQAEVVTLTGLNYSQDLNLLIEKTKNDWIFYIKEGENILEINEDLESLIKTKEHYGCMILKNDTIIKETRLWQRSETVKFKNPVFEKLTTDPTKIIDLIIYQNDDPQETNRLDMWKKSNPLSIEATYYKAFMALSEKRFVDFKSLINNYLFNAKKDISYFMARYYLAFVESMIDRNSEAAIKNIILCLTENPLMAEFWCLLGDIFILSSKFEEAIMFYENAIWLGSRRFKLDMWPMHISKYSDYPNDMISKCKTLIAKSGTFIKDYPTH